MKRLVLFLMLACASLSAHAKLAFIEDDYQRALALAKSKNLPIFVETWAPW